MAQVTIEKNICHSPNKALTQLNSKIKFICN